MKKPFLVTLILLSVLGFAVATGAYLRQVRDLNKAIDNLEDDRAALLVERQHMVEEHAALQQQVQKLQEDKTSLGRSLVTLMDKVAKLQVEAKRTKSTLDAAAIDQAAKDIVAAKEKAAAEKAEKERLAAEAAAKAEADRKRIASEQGPLLVEDLKPLDEKAQKKTDRESLNELLELTAPK